MDQTDVAPTKLPEEVDSPTKSVVETWWQRQNIITRLLGPKDQKTPNERANTLPSGAD